jgi:hypothetical protein
MNRSRRPSQAPRRRPSGPPPPGGAAGGPPRRRTPLDFLPPVEPRFKVLGTVDPRSLTSSAQPMELAVIQLITREIEEAFQKSNLRPEEFWGRHPRLIEQLRRLDDVFSIIVARRAGGPG